MWNGSSRLAVATAIIGGYIFVAPASAQSTAIDVPAQRAGRAAAELGRETNIQILAPRKVTGDKRSKAVHGAMTVDEALRIMLDGTGLEARKTGPRTYSIVSLQMVAAVPIAMQSAINAPARVAAPRVRDPEEAVSVQQEAQAGIEDIVVTASRRPENVQRAALSIQALSSDALTRGNVSKPEDLNGIATGVQVGTGGNYPQVYIRGIGNFGGNAFGESAIAFNLDGVYIAQTLTTRGMFYDLDRIEILKGPQGTLYGRNASGGAINVITAKPNLDRLSSFVEVQGGNYDLIQGTAAVNLPLGETIAIRASGQVVSRDGYLSDGYNDEETRSARLQLLFKPSDDISLLLNGNYQHIGGAGAGGVASPQLPGDKFRPVTDPAVTAIYQAQPGAVQPFYPRTDGYLDYDVFAIGAELNWDLGFATLTVLPAYRDLTQHELSYVGGFPVQTNQRDEQSSLEVRLGNSGEKLKWVIGGFYFDEHQKSPKGHTLQTVIQGPAAQAPVRFHLKTRSYAVFGQATVSLTDAFRVTGGLRYTYERKLIDELLYTYTSRTGGICPAGTSDLPAETIYPPLFCRRTVDIAGRLKYNKVTWKVGVEYDLAPRSMAYASVSTGFKSGGFNQAPAPNAFDAEKLTSFEVGVKNRFLDNSLQVNVEGFYWQYKDHQESNLGTTTLPGYVTFVTYNAGEATSYGMDLDVLFRPTPQDELTLNVQYNKTNFDSFKINFLGAPVVGCDVGPLKPGGFRDVDCSGKPLTRAPLWMVSGGYGHIFDLGKVGSLRASADVRYTSSSWLSADFLDAGRQKSYAIGNFDLAYISDDGRWVVSAFVHNIWNEAVKTKVFRSPFITAANPLADPEGLFIAITRPPRTFGGRVRVNF